MSNYIDLVRADIRRVVLNVLEEAPGYELNNDIIRAALAQLGHNPSHDQLRTELHWLAEQGLLTVRTVGDTTLVAKLTQRGEDVAGGRAHVPGVGRPGLA